MVLLIYLKKNELNIKTKKNPGSCLEVAIQPNLGENGLEWLCYLAGTFQTAPTIFFIFSGYIFLNDIIKNPQTRNARAFFVT